MEIMKFKCIVAEGHFTEGEIYELEDTYYDSIVYNDTIFVILNDKGYVVGLHKTESGAYGSLWYEELTFEAIEE